MFIIDASCAMLAAMRVTILANPDSLHVRRWIKFLAHRGHELTLVTDPDTGQRPDNCSIKLIRYHPLTRLLTGTIGQRLVGNEHWKHIHYRQPVLASQPQVVHGFNAWHFGLATLQCGVWPTVLTPRNSDIHLRPGESKYAGRLMRRVLGGVDRITLPDEAAPNYLADRFGVLQKKVHPFNWGVDLDIFRPGLLLGAQAWNQRLDLPPDAPVVLSPRRFHLYKGSQLLMQSIPAILAERPQTIFVILRGQEGDREDFDRARQQACRQGLDRSIRWIDTPLMATELATLFNRANLFLSIPRTDGMAQTVLEGMACGCLPVCVNHPAYRRYLRDGENGRVLSAYTPDALARAIVTTLNNERLRAEALQINPQQMRQHDNWLVNACEMETVYREAIETFTARNASTARR